MIARLKWIYFLAYAGVGTWLSFFAPYLRGLGFSGEEIGAVSMAQQLVAVPAALAWGALGDRLGSPLRALRFCALGAAVAVIGIPLARTPLSMGATLVLAAAFGGGIVPLVDSITVQAVQGGYARTRLFGSVGFVLSAQALGLLLSARGERPADPLMPLAYVGCVVAYALIAQTFPSAPAREDLPHWREAIALWRAPRLLFVLAICALHWGALGPYHLMFGVRVRDAGLPSSVTGSAMALGVVAEVFALAIFPRLEQRFSLRALFAAFWGCAVEAMQRVVPERLRATGQALFSAVVFGAGNAIGYALAGAGYDRFGSVAPLFACAAAAECLPLGLLLLPLVPERGRAV